MSPAAKGRAQLCSEPHARTRPDHAGRCLDVAQLAAGEDDPKAYSSAAAALAVLAGIAATDAACCQGARPQSAQSRPSTGCRCPRPDRARRRSSSQLTAPSAQPQARSPVRLVRRRWKRSASGGEWLRREKRLKLRGGSRRGRQRVVRGPRLRAPKNSGLASPRGQQDVAACSALGDPTG